MSKIQPHIIAASVQQCLTDLGYFQGKVDGVWRPDSEHALLGLMCSPLASSYTRNHPGCFMPYEPLPFCFLWSVDDDDNVILRLSRPASSESELDADEDKDKGTDNNLQLTAKSSADEDEQQEDTGGKPEGDSVVLGTQEAGAELTLGSVQLSPPLELPISTVKVTEVTEATDPEVDDEMTAQEYYDEYVKITGDSKVSQEDFEERKSDFIELYGEEAEAILSAAVDAAMETAQAVPELSENPNIVNVSRDFTADK